MSGKSECLSKVQACKPKLAEWLVKNPTVLLRWLHDAGALSQETYFTLLEKRPEGNQVNSLLEIMLKNENSCRTFLCVLQQVQEHYNPELRVWLRNTFPIYYKQPTGAIDLEKPEKKSTWSKMKSRIRRVKTYNLEKGGLPSIAPSEHQQLEDDLENHKSSQLKQNVKIQGKLETTNSCCEMLDIRYTELFITDEDPAGLQGQHEYLVLANRRARIYEHNKHQKINLTDILSPLEPSPQGPKTVLMTGIAGIGKTYAMQRIMHEWAIGKAFNNVSCAIHFAFREINLIKEPISLVDLIKQKHAHLQNIAEALCRNPENLLVLLDGLDEFKHYISQGTMVPNFTDPAPIKDLVSSLLNRSLLNGAFIVVTSRPRASLPLDTFDRKVVILGFEERQVEEYCFRFFRQKTISEEVFRYIRKNDSLSGLSFIPLYCFIICTALGPFFQSKPEESCLEKPPETMTEVYRSYLCTILHFRDNSPKVDKEPVVLCSPPVLSNMKDSLSQLGKLAYISLLESKIIFTSDDLRRFGFDPSQLPDSFLHRIFVNVDGPSSTEMFAFFHMTIQEFFAALYCVISISSSAEELLQCLDLWCFGVSPEEPVESPLLATTIKLMTAKQWENLQMFSRFVMGLISFRIEGKLRGLVDSFSPDILIPLTNWFKGKITYEVNQRLLNLLHCLRELRKEAVVEAVAPEIDEVDLFKVILNPADCATLSYVLQHSTCRLKTLNLGYTNIGIQGLRQLQPLLHRCQTLYLRYNSLDKEAAAIEADVLKSPTCQVKSLLMCGNSIGSEGVQCLWEALKYNQTLEELYVDITGITDSGLDNLLPCLANNKTLRLLTIVGNKLSDRGKGVLLELQRRLPDLKILSSFMGDMGLLQAYLDWVQELKENPQQMESVKNVDALHNVLSELRKEDPGEKPPALKERAAELEREIHRILQSSSETGR
ncbi:LOW QUALITY PROTEIN: NACHT, LRR and PYD domains-containing protein 12-like [Rhinoderma darwinii]|uniref:LOW QUALITY PROTEIN: NACHT, LRR and PYD domains-containing protein 12-like n=1 Tax=Rhinoderma darwinii TaxID=43563 RepID=UPI003F672374